MRRVGTLALTCMLGSGCGMAAALSPPQPAPAPDPGTALDWRALRSFTSADGLPQNSVLALLQDSEGRVYAGTLHGLARYDGRHWRTIDLPTGDRAYAVGALALARDGAVWVGTDAAGLWRIATTGTAMPVALPGDGGAINALLESPDGAMWIAATPGLLRCRALRCEPLEGFERSSVRSLFGEPHDGRWRLWVGTSEEGVVALRDADADRPRRSGLSLGREQGLPNNVALSLARFDGDLWIGSGRGLARFDGERLHVYGSGNGFPAAMVFALAPDRDSDGEPVLLAALRPGGLAQIRRDGRWRVLDSRHGLPSNAVHSLMRERHRGALWIGTMTAGIARDERHHWALFDERMGLPDRIVLGVGWSAAKRELWVGTARGGARWGAGWFEPLLPASHNAQLIHDLADAPDGTRWIAHARGLQRWRDDVLEQDYSVDSSALPGVSVERIALRQLRSGYELYAATGHGLARWRADEGLVRVTTRPGDDGAGVHGFATLADASGDGSQVLWVADDLGLARLDTAGWTRPAPRCIEGVAVFGLVAERSTDGETLWLATRNGLRRIDPGGGCVVYPATRRLGALTHVRRVHGDIYVFGARGAMQLRADAPATQPGRRYDAGAGLPSPEIIASALDDRGRLFGATAAGLAALQPDRGDAITTPAPLRLTAALHGAARRPLPPGAVLAPDDSSVRFEYRLFAFDREQQSRYRVQLHGLDTDPGPWSADADVTYPRLPPGDYRLQVQARDADGVRAVPLGFVFSVAAPWWRHPLALLAAALALLTLGLAFGRWRLRAAARRAARLEAEVDARTRELAEANARLEQAAVTDPLTGLRNRRYFALAAEAEAARARHAAPARALLVALLDVDHFKRINDAYGHDAGDAVLVDVARRLQQVARGGDIVLRWGGEEFLLLLRDVEHDGAAALLQRLLQALAQPAIQTAHARIGITASIGAIAFPSAADCAAKPESLEQAITQADAALYRAKRDGRDRAALLDRRADGESHCRMLPRDGSG